MITNKYKKYVAEGVTVINLTFIDNKEIGISTNYIVNNNQDVRTDVRTLMLTNGAMVFDGFDTNSDLAIDRTTGFVNGAWINTFNEGSGRFSLEGNYIFTDRDKTQDLLSTFFDENGATTRTNSFFTDAAQTIDIAVAKADYENTLGNYILKQEPNYLM